MELTEIQGTPRRSTRLQARDASIEVPKTLSKTIKPQGPRSMAKAERSLNRTALEATIVPAPNQLFTAPTEKEKQVKTSEDKKPEEIPLPLDVQKKVQVEGGEQKTGDKKEKDSQSAKKPSGKEVLITAELNNDIGPKVAKASQRSVPEIVIIRPSLPLQPKLQPVAAPKVVEAAASAENILQSVIVESEEEKPAPAPEQPREEIVVKVEKQVNEAEEKVSAAEDSWQPQEPHLVTETSSGMSNDKFHTADRSTIEKFENSESLMDESIILVPDSPSEPKDSTFSPIVDATIRDSRPNIDFLDRIPLSTASVRTSTPLNQRIKKFKGPANTPVAQSAFKPVSILEKSILKGGRRKRSMSVADGESFMQKRVMFNSPQIMEINAIDEKMMASFIEEKENSIMVQAAQSGRRKRSLSTGTPIKGSKGQTRVKVPNFRAIHLQQFEKMESIADHVLRKGERAKKLATPTREPDAEQDKVSHPTRSKETVLAKKVATPTRNTEAARPKVQQLSKIPTMNSRKPLVSEPSIENLTQQKPRLLKRSLSVCDENPSRKKTQAIVAPAVPTSSAAPPKTFTIASGLQRSNSESAKSNIAWNAPSTSNLFSVGVKKTLINPSFGLSAAQSKAKIEERREKNFSLYKTNQTQRTTADHRSRNANLLKGVRLNRRFELQMQHRRQADENLNEN